MKIWLIAFILLLPKPGFGQFYVDNAAPQGDEPIIDFCSQGRFLIFTGNCSLPEKSKFKDSITLKACTDIPAFLSQGLDALYPQTKTEIYQDLPADSVYETLAKPFVLGFFFIGEGDIKGGFVTGPKKEKVYPAIEACISKYDLYGGFTSHSKYSPDVAAPAALRGRILSRTELIYGGAGAAAASWPKLCKPKLSLVYPTRTFAGRMKSDAAKFFETLKEEKKKQVLKTLEGICSACPQYIKAGHPLARLCPPNSDVCKVKKIMPGTEQFILENYCLAIHPEYGSSTENKSY
ncbi:MAG: hypothetical protein NTX59_07155 [Elusimicrobia bacterium]|nr:hypothetical protein [Elusimicrobiota bacterium]